VLAAMHVTGVIKLKRDASMTTSEFIGKLETRILGRENHNLSTDDKKFIYQLSLGLTNDQKLKLLGLTARIRK
jgi:hypothetical protein